MDKHLTVRVKVDDIDRADRIALQSCTTRSDVVRVALLHGLAVLESRVCLDAETMQAVHAARRVVLGGAE
jgi:predicted transcriptional regulator